MSRYNIASGLRIFPLCMALLSFACNRNAEIPFPAEETEFNIPKAKKLRLSEPVPVSWVTVDSDSAVPPVSSRFDFYAVKPQKINTGSFQPFEKPMEEKKFSWNELPDSAFNLNDLKEEKLVYTMTMVSEPIVMPVPPPKINTALQNGFPQLSQNEGLPSNEIYDIMQDKDGQIWFLSGGQLFRYNGQLLESFKLPSGLPLIRLMADSSGLLWIGCDSQQGLIVFDPQAMVEWHIKLHSNIFTITQDHNGLYWVGGLLNGVDVINWKEKTTRNLKFNTGGPAQGFPAIVVDVMRDRRDQLWISANGREYVLNKEQSNFKIIGTDNLLSCRGILRASEDNSGRIFLTYRGCAGFTMISPEEGIYLYAGTRQGFKKGLTSVFQGYDNYLFVPTDSVLYILSPDLKSARTVVTNTDMISSTWYAHMMIDKTGLLWLGSISNGIQFVDTRGLMPQYLNATNGLSENNVFGLAQDDDDNLWLGLNQSIYRGTGKLNMVNAARNEAYDFTAAVDSIFYGVSGMFKDRQGRIWMGIMGRGVYVFDYKQSKVLKYGAGQGIDPLIGNIFEDRQGRIWVGQVNKISIIDPASGRIQISKGFMRDSIDDAQDILEDADHQFWISTYGGGLYKFSAGLSAVSAFETTHGLAGNEVGSIIQDSAGRIWAATNKGLTVIDEKTRVYYNLGKNEGLADDAVYTVLKDSATIYAGTAQGLTIIPGADAGDDLSGELHLKPKTFNKNNGLSLLDFNADIALKLKDGRLAFGIDFKALTIINPVKIDSSAPHVAITGIQLNDRRHSFYSLKSATAVMNASDTLFTADPAVFYTLSAVPRDSGFLVKNKIRSSGSAGGYHMPSDLRLPYEFNSIRFSFAATNYKNITGTRYRYILQGIDKNWSAIGSMPVTETYRDLGPGKYTFKVAACNADGFWSMPADFSFVVEPPWWRSWWAYLLYGATAFALISSFIRYRSRQLTRMNNELEEKIKQRTNELSQSLDELKRTQTQLVQSEKMASLGELTAGIAHEIQNPLNFVNNFSDVNQELIDDLNDEIDRGNTKEAKLIAESLRDNESKINHHGKRADAIVKGMLQHSRNSIGVKESTDLNSLCDEYLRLSYHGLRAKDKNFNAELKIDPDPSVGKINIIPQDIGRVMLNLFNNAFYAVAERKKNAEPGYQPTVKVVTSRIGNTLSIKVIDNGIGMSEQVKAKIFQPFFTTKPTGQGTGLGMSLSYDIITQGHGGMITVKTAEGEGSEFTITLPG